METYAGIDLHSSNNFIGVINDKDKILYGKRHPNRLDVVLRALDPFKDSLQGVVVESTFNWYWLVDGLQDHGYEVHLANPSAMDYTSYCTSFILFDSSLILSCVFLLDLQLEVC